MSSDTPRPPPDKPAAPLERPFPLYINHINDLLRGSRRLQNGLSASSSVTSPAYPAPSDAFAVASQHHPRALPTQDQVDERRRRLIESMMIQYPPNTKGVAQALTWRNPQAENLEGFSKELDNIVDAKHKKTKRYEEFHVEWTDLQNQLLKKAGEMRAKYADLVEQVRDIHHKYTRDRIKKIDYTSARGALTDQMEDVFKGLEKVVLTLGTMYAESRAVAQGAHPTGDYDYGKLDVAACTATPYLKYNFPEFVKKKPSAIPPDPFGPRPSEIAFKHGLPTMDFDDMMATVWAKHPTKLQDFHRVVFKEGFAGIKELTLEEKENANALLGNGCEWSL